MSVVKWNDIMQGLEPAVGKTHFNTWLKSTKLLEDSAGIIVIGVPNHYAKSWIEQNALKKIREALTPYYPAIEEVRLVLMSPEEKPIKNELPILQAVAEQAEEAERDEPASPNPFNPAYTFENFIVGNNNRLAFAAGQVVADKPGSAYNPLFIYGGVGLGKTHLMQAIGNQVLAHSPKKRIVYTSCEVFTNEFIDSLKNKDVDSFKKKFRNVDVLLIDDIQFLANKEGTQEEFFHTFNILHQSKRQIVMTADRLPREINNLEERLTSRFGWGMVVDIQTPNYETRMAILSSKAAERGFTLQPNVLDYLATTITSNVRELEGSLLKLMMAAEVENKPITAEFASQVLRDLINRRQSQTTVKSVIQAISRYFDTEVVDIIGPRRQKELVYPRQIAMYLLRDIMHLSYPQIGDALGGRDHTTIMHGADKIEKEAKVNQATENDLKNIRQAIRD
jgi:chromosomal replication initiator protein